MLPRVLEQKLVLDTSVLLSWWNTCRSRCKGELTVALTRQWAQELMRIHNSKAIVSPVYIEVIAGVVQGNQLRLTRAFLEEFDCVDRELVPKSDWQEAKRLAQWIRQSKRPRDLGDCLIRAIARRLHCEVLTFDEDFPG